MTSVEQLAAETAATYRNLHGMATATGSPEPEELLTMVRPAPLTSLRVSGANRRPLVSTPQVEKIKAAEPGNRCTKYFDVKYYESLDPADRDDFWACIRTGVDNPDSGLGCYAMTPARESCALEPRWRPEPQPQPAPAPVLLPQTIKSSIHSSAK